MCSQPSDSRFSLRVPFEQVFRLVWLIIKRMMDSSQLTVIRGKSTMVLSISSGTQFLTLKVAVTLTLIAEIAAVLTGVVLHL